MSLLSEAMETSVRMIKTQVSDGYGASTTTWADGTEIQAAYVLDTSAEGRLALKPDARNRYYIVTEKAVSLLFGEVIKRSSDSKYFRITSDGTDKKTPISAGLDMRVVTAEEVLAP